VQRTKNANVVRAIFPKAINVPNEVLLPMSSKHFVCLTIGSRGDVQPYIALGKGLQKEGHRVTIVTHEEYKEWITGFGIDHRTAGGDPGALMKLSVENKVSCCIHDTLRRWMTLVSKMFSPQFFKESISNVSIVNLRSNYLTQIFPSSVPGLTSVSFLLLVYRDRVFLILHTVLVDSWEQCKDAEVLLESPSVMAGVHIAEALRTLFPYAILFETRGLILLQISHTSGPLLCPGRSMFLPLGMVYQKT
jgi:sterol 3beta-glucosyltransferase